jgi:hypothetical protein
MNPIPLCLVTNPATFADRPDALERQTTAWNSVIRYRPVWCVTRRAATYNDFRHLEKEIDNVYCLKRDSHEIADTKLHLPFVRELMKVAGYPLSLREDSVSGKAHWRGILNNDTVIGPQFFGHFQTVDDDVNCIFVRVHDVATLPPPGVVPAEARPRNNFNSLEGLFLRGKAVEIFEETYPDMIFGWAWDEASVLWGTNNDLITIHAIDHPRAALHVVHESPARAGGLGAGNDIADYNGAVLNKYFESL